jgi:nucleotide-binding universal stress UspA family protein
MFKRVLVAIDMSPESIRGLKTAIALAGDQRAELHVVHIFDERALPSAIADGDHYPAMYNKIKRDDARASAQSFLDGASATAGGQGFAVHPVLLEKTGEDIAHSILAQARKVKADVIVLGTHGRRGLRRMVMGSDAEAVVRESPVPVMLVRGEETPKRRSSPAKGWGPTRHTLTATATTTKTTGAARSARP